MGNVNMRVEMNRIGGIDPKREAMGSILGVIIPAYQVAPHISNVIRAIPPFVDHIIVVDDASRDNLKSVLAECGDARLKILTHDRNRGVGGATLTGYEEAVKLGCDVLIKVDGDGQMDPGRIAELVEPVVAGTVDYAKGNRFLHPRELRQMPRLRRYGNLALTFLTKCASGYWFMFDPTNGFTALHRRAWRRLSKGRLSSRYFFEISLLIELGCQRAVIGDVGIPARYGNEESSLSPLNVALEFPLRLVAGTLRRLLRWYFLYDFTPVSLFLLSGTLFLSFAVGWGGYHWAKSSSTGVPATTGTIMLSVVSLILGVQVLLQAWAMDTQSSPRIPVQRTSEPEED